MNKPIFENEQEARKHYYDVTTDGGVEECLELAKNMAKVAKEKGYIKKSTLEEAREKYKNSINKESHFATLLKAEMLIQELEKEIEGLKKIKGDNMEERTKIFIYFTKTRKFRARIIEPEQKPYEVTIGGESWHNGKGKKYADFISAKCRILFEDMTKEYKNLVKQEVKNE